MSIVIGTITRELKSGQFLIKIKFPMVVYFTNLVIIQDEINTRDIDLPTR